MDRLKLPKDFVSENKRESKGWYRDVALHFQGLLAESTGEGDPSGRVKAVINGLQSEIDSKDATINSLKEEIAALKNGTNISRAEALEVVSKASKPVKKANDESDDYGVFTWDDAEMSVFMLRIINTIQSARVEFKKVGYKPKDEPKVEKTSVAFKAYRKRKLDYYKHVNDAVIKELNSYVKEVGDLTITEIVMVLTIWPYCVYDIPYEVPRFIEAIAASLANIFPLNPNYNWNNSKVSISKPVQLAAWMSNPFNVTHASKPEIPQNVIHDVGLTRDHTYGLYAGDIESRQLVDSPS